MKFSFVSFCFRVICAVRSVSCAGSRDRGPCCNWFVPVHRGSVVQRLSMRFDQIYEQESDLHRAVLINLTMATSFGDSVGVLVCLRRSQQVSYSRPLIVLWPNFHRENIRRKLQ